MISKVFSPRIATICKETIAAFSKTKGKKAITECAKELGVDSEILYGFSWPSQALNKAQYASVKIAQAIDAEPSPMVLKIIPKAFNVNAALKAYQKV